MCSWSSQTREKSRFTESVDLNQLNVRQKLSGSANQLRRHWEIRRKPAPQESSNHSS